MAWRFHGHAQTDATSPRAYAVCDRCSRWWNHDRLSWQWQWAGNGLVNLRLLVCPDCLDLPQEQLRSIILPPDPLPVTNPRPENFASDDLGVSAAQSSTPPDFGPPILDE